MSPFHRRLARLIVGTLMVPVLLAPASALAAVPGGPTCCGYLVPVAVGGRRTASGNAPGQLCYTGPSLPRTVQLLVHGITTSHLYWDFPLDNAYYSYVRTVTAAGYATFNFDPLGAGASTRPASIAVPINSGTVARHIVIQ
jgi:hypothetical protein